MTARIVRFISWLVIKHTWLVAAAIVVLTGLLYYNIRHLRLGTDVTDLFGNRDPQWRAINEFSQKLGYGNQLFAVIETPALTDDSAEQMEAMADRLVADMDHSGLFRAARCSLTQEELMGMLHLFAWNFPVYAQPSQWPEIKQQLSERQIRETIQQSSAGLVTPFSSFATNYFTADPLGLTQVVAKGTGLGEYTNFDLGWGSGNHFFSKDHKAILVVAEPRVPAADYQFAQQVLGWMRQQIRGMGGEDEFKGLSVTLAGPYLYAEQDREFIQANIRLVSLASIIGSVVLCLVIYPRVPLFLLSLLPTSLGILWTTGIAAYYPGEINLISLSFIAILAGLGDDQVVHFFNRVPQEWRIVGSLDEAMRRTYQTTGQSILFCILTMGTATAALATAKFKALAEFGFVLSVGLAMLLVHTVFTVPALMRLWWKVAKPKAPESVTFRFLPAIAGSTVDFVGRHARTVFIVAGAAFVLSLGCLPWVRMDRKIEITLSAQNPAIAGQKRLGEKFGIEGSPEIFLVKGSEEEVLQRSEKLTAALGGLSKQGIVKSVFSPSSILPSFETQAARAQIVRQIDLNRVAQVLEDSLRANGFRVEQFQPTIQRLRQLAKGSLQPLGLEQISEFLPRGLMENSVRKTGDNEYLAAISFYPTDPDATDVIPDATRRLWQEQFGAFTQFSFNQINRDLQAQIHRDSRRAMLLTSVGIVVIVFLCFRSVRISLLVLTPIVFAIVVTFGVLVLVGHHFSFMAITALPLIVGIGIDNGIHLVQRYLQGQQSILDIAKASGPALIQSSLTTLVGFGALLLSSFDALAEMGLVTTIGVALALGAALWIVPAIVLVLGPRATVGVKGNAQ
ncbi:MAG TPA: MMPL family transporter [Candidatus Sulfotelmatobacter sp.]|nr:MMPL family transporter [Candidatus Sulfotelmatobacter sp.]